MSEHKFQLKVRFGKNGERVELSQVEKFTSRLSDYKAYAWDDHQRGEAIVHLTDGREEVAVSGVVADLAEDIAKACNKVLKNPESYKKNWQGAHWCIIDENVVLEQLRLIVVGLAKELDKNLIVFEVRGDHFVVGYDE